jgi:hypothetical protein
MIPPAQGGILGFAFTAVLHGGARPMVDGVGEAVMASLPRLQPFPLRLARAACAKPPAHGLHRSAGCGRVSTPFIKDRINREEAYSFDGACTNMAES